LKTLLWSEIDSHKIIVGFDLPVVDPESTKNKIMPLFLDTDETRAVDEKSREMEPVRKALTDAKKARRDALKSKDTVSAAKHQNVIDIREEQLSQLNDELIVLLASAEVKRQDLYNENLQYFETKKGEEIIEDTDERIGKFLLLGKGEKLNTDGVVIKDNRGVQYIKNGKIETVSSLGAEPDGTLVSELTADEIEVLRIKSLSDEDKAKEFEALKSSAAIESASMKATLEIQGDADALKKAQSYYAEKVKEIDKKYS
jgi:hypothetical protein